jgi:superfamily I DNA and RNA helicase
VGCDSLCHYLNLKNRNLLFTAMTRTKGWLHMTAYGDAANDIFNEVRVARAKSPEIQFKFPSPKGLERIKMDLQKRDHSMSSERRKLERLASSMGGTAELEKLLMEIKASEKKNSE